MITFLIFLRGHHMHELSLLWWTGELADVPHQVLHAGWTSIQDISGQLHILIKKLHLQRHLFNNYVYIV